MSATDPLAELTSVRKAAVLLASLEPGQAASILRRLRPESAERLRKEMAALGAALTPDVRAVVCGEFYDLSITGPSGAGGSASKHGSTPRQTPVDRQAGRLIEQALS